MVRVMFCWSERYTKGDWLQWMTWRDFWRETCKSFGVDEYLVMDLRQFHEPRLKLSAEEGKYSARVLYKPSDLDDLGRTCVLRPHAGTPLDEYEHPEEVTYVFGPDMGDQPMFRANDEVRIETPVDYGLWSLISCGIVLHDRFLKSR